MSNSKKPTWYILGAGAIGCLWAAYYRQEGFPVVLITRQTQQYKYLNLHNNSGTHQYSVCCKTAGQINDTIHYLLICTKAQQTVAAVNTIKSSIDSNASVLILQNGMATEQLPSQLLTQHLFAGVTTDGAYRVDYNTVIHAGVGHTFIGAVSLFHNIDNASLIKHLPTDHLHIKSCDDIKTQQWKKLALNCVINGLTAIYNCRNGELLTTTKARQHVKALCEETFTIINSLGITIADSAETLYQQVEAACTITATNYSSMHQDIKYKRPTEVDYINGYLCQQAEKKALNCQENANIVRIVKQLECY